MTHVDGGVFLGSFVVMPRMRLIQSRMVEVAWGRVTRSFLVTPEHELVVKTPILSNSLELELEFETVVDGHPIYLGKIPREQYTIAPRKPS